MIPPTFCVTPRSPQNSVNSRDITLKISRRGDRHLLRHQLFPPLSDSTASTELKLDLRSKAMLTGTTLLIAGSFGGVVG
jgi:hypothetical protein